MSCRDSSKAPTTSIFLDTNVAMYAAGAEHQLRQPCIDVLELITRSPREFWTDAEVLQEILHRYLAQRRWELGKRLLDRFAELMEGRIEPIMDEDVQRAGALAEQMPGLGARDLLHIAVMTRMGTDTLVSADRGFDQAPGIRRLDPADIAVWRDETGVR